MSIRSQLKPYLLQEVIISKDALGCDITDYKDVCYINVTVDERHKTHIEKDLLYTKTSVTGITFWNNFDRYKNYVLKRCDVAYLDGKNVLDGTLTLDGCIAYDKFYKVNSVISGRLTQLALEEVVTYE